MYTQGRRSASHFHPKDGVRVRNMSSDPTRCQDGPGGAVFDNHLLEASIYFDLSTNCQCANKRNHESKEDIDFWSSNALVWGSSCGPDEI